MADLDELIEQAEELGIEVSEDDDLDVLTARIEAHLETPEPEPRPKPVRKKTTKATARKPEPTSSLPDEDSVEVPASLPGLPPTHQPFNQDPAVRFDVDPSGVRRPMKLV